MALPTITVNLAELLGEDGEPQSLADRIVAEAAQSIVRDFRRQIFEEVQQSVRSQVRALVAERIAEVFASQMFETDQWGNRRSDKASTMAEMVMHEAMKHLEEKVNDRGNTDYGDRTMTRLAWIARTAAKDLVEKQLQPQVKAAQDEIKAAVGDKLSAAFKAALKDAAAAFA